MLQRQNRQAGQTALLFAMGLTTMFGVIGLVSDVGYVYYRKQNAQAAAQAAAIAAVQQAFATGGVAPVCNGTTVLCNSYANQYTCPTSISGTGSNNFEVACLYAKANGYSGRQVKMEGGTTVPREGVEHITYWATARVTETLPLLFSVVSGGTSTTLTARSTAAYVPPTGSGCIYVLAQTGSSLTASGNAALNTSCGVWDDSNDTNAVNLNGQNSYINATGTAVVQIVGSNPGYSCYGGTTGCITPAPTTGAVNSGDPLLQLPAPTNPGTCTPVPSMSPHTITTVSNPGTVKFCSGFTVGNNDELDLSPGTYIFSGCSGSGFKVDAQATLNGSNVFLYFEGTGNGCSPSFSAGASVTLSAPASGPYDGILMFQARDDQSTAYLTGGGTQLLTGIVYFPDAQLNYTGGSTSNSTGQNATIIANTMQFTGSSYIRSAANSPYTSGISGVVTIE